MSSAPLFRIFDIGVRVDRSWVIIAVLVTWSLATGFFPAQVPGEGTGIYWIMGLLGALGLFASILFHELCHSLLARRFGIEIRGITLFIFGGVAEMGGEPREPKEELLVAGIGPVSSAFLALVGVVLLATLGPGVPAVVVGLVWYLTVINFVLAAFNTIPAFPLDGGRVLRAVLWWRGRSLVRATRITARIGAGFGVLMMVLGGISIVRGSFLGGVWWILIGIFLRNAAEGTRRGVELRGSLEGIPVERFLIPDPVSDVPLGAVSPEEPVIAVGDDALAALRKMQELQTPRLTVVDDAGRPLGILTLEDLARFVAASQDRSG